MPGPESSQASTVTGAAPAVPLSSSNAITYTYFPTIVRMLEDVCSKRATLTIRIDTDSGQHIFHSRIQLVDPAHKQLVLHKLSPTGWQDMVTQELNVEVICQLSSGMLLFQCTLSPLEAENINPYCVLSLPELLYKHQLRSSFRVNLPPGSSMLTIPHQDRIFSGYCLNLSLEGCCGIFRGDLDWSAHDGVIPVLTVSLDDSLQFTTAATICRKQLMQNGSIQLGLRFETLEADMQRKLQASLTSLQRRQLRKYS